MTNNIARLQDDIRRVGIACIIPKMARLAGWWLQNECNVRTNLRSNAPDGAQEEWAAEDPTAPPPDYRPSEDQVQDPQIQQAIGRAWGWWRRMEAGEFAIIQLLAEALWLAERNVSRQLLLAYLAPEVLKRLKSGG